MPPPGDEELGELTEVSIEELWEYRRLQIEQFMDYDLFEKNLEKDLEFKKQARAAAREAELQAAIHEESIHKERLVREAKESEKAE